MRPVRSKPQSGHRRWQLLALLLAACGTLAGCAATTHPRTPDKDAPTSSATGAPPPAEDFTRLRTEYGEREDFFAICESGRPEGLREVSKFIEAHEWDHVLDVSQPWVKECPVDITAQMLTAAALTELGRKDEAQEHIRWYRGLVESVLASGDGRTPAQAYVVISISEEYAVLRALQLRPTKQALMGGGIDALTVESNTGPATVYFNPAAHFRRLDRELKPGASDKGK